MKYTTIAVTADHLRVGDIGKPASCPLAIAMLDAGALYPRVFKRDGRWEVAWWCSKCGRANGTILGCDAGDGIDAIEAAHGQPINVSIVACNHETSGRSEAESVDAFIDGEKDILNVSRQEAEASVDPGKPGPGRIE